MMLTRSRRGVTGVEPKSNQANKAKSNKARSNKAKSNKARSNKAKSNKARSNKVRLNARYVEVVAELRPGGLEHLYRLAEDLTFVRMTEQDYQTHITKVKDSEGFDSDAVGYTELDYRGPLLISKTDIQRRFDELKGYCSTVIKDYNAQYDKNLKVVDVVQATSMEVGIAAHYYLTFTAVEAEDSSSAPTTYQAKVHVPYRFTGKPQKTLRFRLKPSSS